MAAREWPATWVRERLGYEPRDLALFGAALTHRSAAALMQSLSRISARRLKRGCEAEEKPKLGILGF